MADKKGNQSVGNGFNFLNQPGPQKQQVVTTDGQRTVRIIGGQKFVAISLGRVITNPLRPEEVGRKSFGSGSSLGKPKRVVATTNSRDRSRGDFH